MGGGRDPAGPRPVLLVAKVCIHLQSLVSSPAFGAQSAWMGNPIGLRFGVTQICFGCSAGTKKTAISALAALVQPMLPALSPNHPLLWCPVARACVRALKANVVSKQCDRCFLQLGRLYSERACKVRGKCCAQSGAGVNTHTHHLVCWLCACAAGCVRGRLLCTSLYVAAAGGLLLCRASKLVVESTSMLQLGSSLSGLLPEGHPKPEHNTHCCVKCMYAHVHAPPPLRPSRLCAGCVDAPCS